MKPSYFLLLAPIHFALAAAPIRPPEPTGIAVAPGPLECVVVPDALRRVVVPDALQRVVVVGASASAGFLLPSDLAEALELLMQGEHGPVLGLADSHFFMDPYAYAERQIAAALEADPTLVVALDFLFWFSYGALSDSRRERLLERGFEYLERLDCPILTSTVPDMRASIGRMLWPSQVPSVETLAALNRRIESWAAGRSNVVLVSLPEWHAQLLSKESFDIDGRVWPPAVGAPLLQWDELHPNADGLALLACKVYESLLAGGVDIERSALELDPSRVADPIHARLRSIVRSR